MSFLSKAPISNTPQQLNSINVDRSRYGDAVPLLYGMQRIPVMLGWYGNFQSNAQTNNAGKGGGSQITGWSYSASCVMIMCEGPLPLSPYVRAVWQDKSITTYETLGFYFFGGGIAQAPWSYLTSNFPGQDVPYQLTAYFGAENLALGSTAGIPNFTFEVMGLLCNGPAHTVTLTGGIGAGGTSCVISGSSPVPDGTYNVGFSDFETRRATFVTVSGTTTVSWNSQWGLTNAVGATMTIGGYDVEPSAILVDYATDVQHGCDFDYLDTAQIQTLSYVIGGTTYFNSYKVYCEALGLYISPWEDTQRSASGFFQDILELTNSDCFMSALNFCIVPFGDTIVSGNGVTFTPNNQPLFSFDDDDYRLQTTGTINDPVVLTAKPLTETYNTVRVEFYDRGNNYNAALAEWSDPVDVAQNGARVMPTKTFHQITNAATAYQVAALIGQRQLYVVNKYTFAVRSDLYGFLEPMDMVSITDAGLGITDLLVRIVQVEDDADDLFIITAEDALIGVGNSPVFNLQDAQGYYANFDAVPPACATPVIFSVPPALGGAAGGYRIGIAAGPASPTGSEQHVYGGCEVMLSMDNLTWMPTGVVNGSARFGTVTTGHAISASTTGAADTFYFTMAAEVYEEGYQLDSATAADFAANRSLFWVDGEIIAFETVTLLSPANYSVSVTRGLFGTPASAHSAGASWARLDAEIFQFDFDPGMIGQTLYYELYSFNDVGRQLATTPTTGTYVIENYNVGQLIGGPLQIIGSGVGINANSVWCIDPSSNYFATEQGYVNGCFMQFTPLDIANEVTCGIASDQTNPASSHLAAFQLSNTAPGSLYVVEQQVGDNVSFTGIPVGTYAPGDILIVAFDGNYIRYYQNGNILRTTSIPENDLILYGAGYYALTQTLTPPGTIKNVAFGPAGVSSPIVWNSRGDCFAGNRVATKIGGSAAFDSDVFSVNGYPSCNLNFKPSQTNTAICGGLVLEPIADWAGVVHPNWEYLNYAFYLNDIGIWSIVESGTTALTGTAYDTTTLFSITWDGATLIYLVNNVSVRTVSISAPQAFAELCFRDPGGVLSPTDFGPGTMIPSIDTAELGQNSVSDFVQAYNAGPVNATSGTVPVVVATLMVAAQDFAYTALIDLSYITTLSGAGSDTDQAQWTTNSVTTAFNMTRATLGAASGQLPVKTEVRQAISIAAGQSVTFEIICSAVSGGITAAFTDIAFLGTILFR